MRLGILLAVNWLILSCGTPATKSNSDFLQSNEIQLVAPRLEASQSIIDSVATLSANLDMEGVILRYTLDGTEPKETSLEYKSPITVRDAGTYTFRAFHDSFKSSALVQHTFYKQGVLPHHLEWESQASEKYLGQGDLTLLNHKRASVSFTDREWMGFDTIAVAKVQFKNQTPLKKLQIGYLLDPSSWIFPPEAVELLMKDSLGTRRDLKVEIPELDKFQAPATLQMLEIQLDHQVLSLEIRVLNTMTIPTWHEGKGTKGWLFMDELLFYK